MATFIYNFLHNLIEKYERLLHAQIPAPFSPDDESRTKDEQKRYI